jgi:hypothetical protein
MLVISVAKWLGPVCSTWEPRKVINVLFSYASLRQNT